MKTVIIEDRGEYTARLIPYLEKKGPGDLHIIECSDLEKIKELELAEACYIGGQDFLQKLGEQFYRKIPMGQDEVPGQFCIFHSPAKLLAMIEECFAQEKIGLQLPMDNTTITAIYMPTFVKDFRSIALELMQEGELCLGMENLGFLQENTGDMGDLCYYIHLRQENLPDQIREMANLWQGRYFIESPCVYYDLLELTEEDLLWFFDILKKSSLTRSVYLALGSGMVKNPDLFRHFDRVILLYDGEEERAERFCSRFQQIMDVKQINPRGGFDFLDRNVFLR